MRRSAPATSITYLALGALLMSACARAGTVAVTNPAVDPSDYPDTISRMVNGTPEEVDALDRLQFAESEHRVQRCMVEAGYAEEYIPARLFQGLPGGARAHDLPLSPPLPMDEARAHGWGILERAMHPPPDPQIPPTGLRSQAYQQAHNVCERLRDSTRVTEYPQDSLSQGAAADADAAFEALWRDPAFDRAITEYQACMAGFGFSDDLWNVLYYLEEDMHGAVGTDDQPKLESLFEEEVAFAAADSTCRTPVYPDLLEARARVEAPVIARHRDEFEALKATWQDILRRAPSREDAMAL